MLLGRTILFGNINCLFVWKLKCLITAFSMQSLEEKKHGLKQSNDSKNKIYKTKGQKNAVKYGNKYAKHK